MTSPSRAGWATGWPSCRNPASRSWATGRPPTAPAIRSSPTSWPGARTTKRRISMSPRSREIRVGLVILAALVVVAAGIFLIGDKNNLFSRKARYHVEFNSVSGLKPGSPVQLDGVDVGTVERVTLPEDPRQKQIRVWIRVDREYAARLRGPVDPRAL